MSQPTVTAYFSSRKRHAREELLNKAKVRLLDQDQLPPSKVIEQSALDDDTSAMLDSSAPVKSDVINCPKIVLVSGKTNTTTTAAPMKHNAVQNLTFDSPKIRSGKIVRATANARTTRSQNKLIKDGQMDIREGISKLNAAIEPVNVPFSKMSALSPKKKSVFSAEDKQQPAGLTTPTKKTSTMSRLNNQNLSLNDIKNKINKSSRLAELKASIARIKNCDERLNELKKQNNTVPQIRNCGTIELEIPVSPQKACKSPTKLLMSPMKDSKHLQSPQKRLLLEPKETSVSPIKASPTKAPAYQRYLSIAEKDSPALPLPYDYRFLAEAFRCVDTVVAMLFNRKETITFKKLKNAVQELLRRNFTLDHLAQIKFLYPDAFTYKQEKYRMFGSTMKPDEYELTLMPNVETRSGRNTPDADNVLNSGSKTIMNPPILLERRRRFYELLLDRVKNEHEKFLLSLESPMIIPKNKILRWHPEFDVEKCKPVEKSELPKPPQVEKASSAKDVLEKAKSLFNCGTRVEKALQRLAEAQKSAATQSPEVNSVTETEKDSVSSPIVTSVVDTPPTTPKTQTTHVNPALKGIPKSLLEKVRAKQAAKALEAMTRTPTADKEAALYSRLPELAKILRNIFVGEKKSVLTMDFVIVKLDNSFRTKLTPNELEQHIRALCEVVPVWISIHAVRQVNYLKTARNVDFSKVIKKLENKANEKVTVT